MSKDWVGNYNSLYRTLGASNHTSDEREINDYYATQPKAVEMLCELEKEFCKDILEPACGEGHISKTLEKLGYNVESHDLIDRGFGECPVDFLKTTEPIDKDVITNPPYKYASEFVEHAMDLVTNGHKVAMFLKLQFLEGQKRKKLFQKYPIKTVYVSSGRLGCAKNGNFKVDKDGNLYEGGCVAFAWFVWEKGYTGDTVIKWFN